MIHYSIYNVYELLNFEQYNNTNHDYDLLNTYYYAITNLKKKLTFILK